MKKVTIAVATVAVLAAGGLFASNSAGMKHCKGGHHMGKIIKQLDLTSAQKSQLKAMRGDMNPRKMMQKRISPIIESIDDQGFNKTLFIENARTNFEASIEKRADKFEKMYQVLTPEQKTKLVDIINEKKR